MERNYLNKSFKNVGFLYDMKGGFIIVKIQDLRGDIRILGPTNPSRLVSGITKISRHHSATAIGDIWAFQNYWKDTLGWGTGGYHEIILSDGTIQLIYNDNVTTNGISGHNTNTYHICLVGSGVFTAVQETAFDVRARAAMERFKLNVSDVLGHNEFSGNASTNCPGINMNIVRNRLRGNNTDIVGENVWHLRSGTVTVTTQAGINLRGTSKGDIVNPTSLGILAVIKHGQKIIFDRVLVQSNGHAFVRQPRKDGFGWLAIGATKNGKVVSYWVSGITI